MSLSASEERQGARRGADVLRRIRERPPALWYRGERVADVTTHPALRRGVAALADSYDLKWRHEPETLFDSPTSGHKVARTFQLPRTSAELAGVGRAMAVVARASYGMLGRVPDYLNRAVSAYAAGADYLAAADPRFGANARRLHEELREADLSLTHSLIAPQANRSVGPSRQADPYLAARVLRETDAGFIVRGCRMLATLPFADALLVLPSTLLKATPEDAPYAFGFVIASDAQGLKYLCRESVDPGGSRFDHPFASRFEEMDAVVVFDDVHVPWENVLLYRNVEHCNQANARTGALAGMAHQVVVKNIAKTEFVLGLAALLVDTIGAEAFQHVQEKLAEVWITLETMRAFLRAAEADAAPDEWGVVRPAWNPLDAARNLYPRLYPRMIEIVQQLGASGLVAMPTEQDLKGPLADDVRRYFTAARAEAYDRVPLFKLAWDVALSAFGGRQVLYERFFFGDPVRMASALVATHGDEIRGYADRVRELVRELRDEAFASEK